VRVNAPILRTIFLSLILVTASTVAQARDKVGNGGSGFSCKDASGNIKSVYLLDLFEGTFPLFPRKVAYQYPSNVKSVDSELDRVFDRSSVNISYAVELLKMIDVVKQSMVMLPGPARLDRTDDIFPEIHPDGCEFAQIANFVVDDEKNHRLDVDTELYSKLDNLGKAGLIVHEAVYALSRRYTLDSDSVRSRRITAMLMSSDDLSSELREELRQVLPEPVAGQRARDFLKECKPDSKVTVELKIEGLGSKQEISAYMAGQRGSIKSSGPMMTTDFQVPCAQAFEPLTWVVTGTEIHEPYHYLLKVTLDDHVLFEESQRSTAEWTSGHLSFSR